MMDKSSQELYDVIVGTRKVEAFGQAMKKKLAENSSKGNWKDCPLDYLIARLHQEIDELDKADDSELLNEAADIANFLMMYCDNRGLLKE